MANPARYYPKVENLDEAHEAIKQLHDHVYTLRDDLQAMRQSMTAMHESQQKTMAKVASLPATAPPGIVDNLAGVRIKVVTSPDQLTNGMTVKYNAATGQFEFS